MRQGQHKQQRARGRGRKVHNPSNRSYDSNGPDVKIRGTAVHVAEKYTTLARDAQVAGDRVASENYLQHAEHYNRIVAANQANVQQQQAQQQASQNASNAEDANVVAEESAAVSTSDAAPVENNDTTAGEETPKAPPNAGRQRRRRSSSGRNGGTSRAKEPGQQNSENSDSPQNLPVEAASVEASPVETNVVEPAVEIPVVVEKPSPEKKEIAVAEEPTEFDQTAAE